MNQFTNKAWQQYEAGKAHKRRLGLYEAVKRNEAFYRGEQWRDGEGMGLPKPVFNLVRRVADYLVCSIASSDITLRFNADALPFANEQERKLLSSAIDTLGESAAFRWESNNIDAKLVALLTDAAISGDGAIYCWWDTNKRGTSDYDGDITTEVIDALNIFPSDVNSPDIQSQEYIIISGRSSVASLRAEARSAGATEEELSRIVPDDDTEARAGAMGSMELEGEDEAKATFIIKFWRDDGKVCFEKSVKECVIRRGKTDCRLYPVAFFNWTPAKNSFHGASPVSAMIPNQQYVNRAYAMAMKHMTDTAFSKVVYDRSKIPEWSNEVGEAIAAVGGGNIADAVSVIGTGEMQSGYMELIDSAVTLTKELMGATESALGNLDAHNTSAILALQETSRVSLENVRRAFYKCVEDMADIWTDMMCAYYPADRLVPCGSADEAQARTIDPQLIRRAMFWARVDVAELTRYSAAGTQAMLDKLLDGGHITPAEYISRLPAGLIPKRDELIAAMCDRDTGKEII